MRKSRQQSESGVIFGLDQLQKDSTVATLGTRRRHLPLETHISVHVNGTDEILYTLTNRGNNRRLLVNARIEKL